jgi:Uma2 family endonuclease
VWELARLFPRQGDWTEAEYLEFEAEDRIEYLHGCLEFLPMPTRSHEMIVKFLFRLLDDFVRARRMGEVFANGYKVCTIAGAFRLPDVFFVRHDRPQSEQHSSGADLCVEVVSGGREDRSRDLDEKRIEYAAAGIPEYWIVDPETKTTTVLTLEGSVYRVHGEFMPGDTATSLLLPDFAVDVRECFAAAE